jgi:hypothetical protein
LWSPAPLRTVRTAFAVYGSSLPSWSRASVKITTLRTHRRMAMRVRLQELVPYPSFAAYSLPCPIFLDGVPDPRQRPFGLGIALSGRLWIPVAFRLPAFASWVILSRWRICRRCRWLTGLKGIFPSSRPDPHRGCHVPHFRDATGVGVLFTPGPRCPRDEHYGFITSHVHVGDGHGSSPRIAVFVNHLSGDLI